MVEHGLPSRVTAAKHPVAQTFVAATKHTREPLYKTKRVRCFHMLDRIIYIYNTSYKRNDFICFSFQININPEVLPLPTQAQTLLALQTFAKPGTLRISLWLELSGASELLRACETPYERRAPPS